MTSCFKSQELQPPPEKEKKKKVLTVDNSPLPFPTAEATAEKYLLVKKREKGAPFPRPWRASLAHSETRNGKNRILSTWQAFNCNYKRYGLTYTTMTVSKHFCVTK